MNVEELVKKYKIEYDKIIIILTENSTKVKFYKIINNELTFFYIKPKEIRSFYTYIHNKYQNEISSNSRFNKLEIDILPNGKYEENYIWDNEKEYKGKLVAAKYFGHWANELMMNRIFEYEEEQKLLEYDEEYNCYKQSWDKGVFTFEIINKELIYIIELYKDGVRRLLEMPLHKTYIEPFIEHYNITNDELKNDWKPWNKLVVKSPHNDILNEEEGIIYSLDIRV